MEGGIREMLGELLRNECLVVLKNNCVDKDDYKNKECINKLISKQTCIGDSKVVISLLETNICDEKIKDVIKQKHPDISSGAYGSSFTAVLNDKYRLRIKMVKDSSWLYNYYIHLREFFYGWKYVNRLTEFIPNFVYTHGLYICDGGKDFEKKGCLSGINNIFGVIENLDRVITFQEVFEIYETIPPLLLKLDRKDPGLKYNRDDYKKLGYSYKSSPNLLRDMVNSQFRSYNYSSMYHTHLFINIFIQICISMQFLYEMTGISHGDMHFGNILLQQKEIQTYSCVLSGKNIVINIFDGNLVKIIDYSFMNDGKDSLIGFLDATKKDINVKSDIKTFLNDFYLQNDRSRDDVDVPILHLWLYYITKTLALRSYNSWLELLEEFKKMLVNFGLDGIYKKMIKIN